MASSNFRQGDPSDLHKWSNHAGLNPIRRTEDLVFGFAKAPGNSLDDKMIPNEIVSICSSYTWNE